MRRGRRRRADHALRLAELDLDPFGQRQVDALFHRPQRRQRRGILPLRRPADRPFRHAEGEVQLVVAQAQRLFLFAAELFPLARLLRVVDQATALFH